MSGKRDRPQKLLRQNMKKIFNLNFIHYWIKVQNVHEIRQALDFWFLHKGSIVIFSGVESAYDFKAT